MCQLSDAECGHSTSTTSINHSTMVDYIQLSVMLQYNNRYMHCVEIYTVFFLDCMLFAL